MAFSKDSLSSLEKWLDYRQRIYTMIIAHPECIPYNALQTDLVRIAIKNKIISPSDWYLSEPVFEEALRNQESSKALADQLISGCDYQTVDYVWVKNFSTEKKLNNTQITEHLSQSTATFAEHGYFVWNEKGLISRKVNIDGTNWQGQELGINSTSCMIALVKKTAGKPKWTKAMSNKWRRDVLDEFANLFGVREFKVDFPETYTGEFFDHENNEIRADYY